MSTSDHFRRRVSALRTPQKAWIASDGRSSDPAAFNSFSHSTGDKIPGALAGTRTLSIAFSGLLLAYDRFTAKEKSADTAVWKLFKLFGDCSRPCNHPSIS